LLEDLERLRHGHEKVMKTFHDLSDRLKTVFVHGTGQERLEENVHDTLHIHASKTKINCILFEKFKILLK
jgi:hypothetical protein